MLRQRVITAVILLPPVLAAALWLPDRWLAAVLALAALIAALEWATLSARLGSSLRIGYAAVVAVLAYALAVAGSGRLAQAANLLLWFAGFAWLLAPLLLFRYPRGFAPGRGWRRLAAGVLMLPAAVIGLLHARDAALGVAGLPVLLALVWAADIAAYFAGHAFGRHPLAPALSPGKTWEGFAGGMLGALIVGVIAGALLPGVPRAWPEWLALCLVTAAISVVGDLCESLLKRLAGVKDSGALLPGHGGLLDRIDSLIAAAPVFAAGLHALGLG
ncbi:MAG: phosphatidate cytidylyltransferase [Gammaproteobacteria bacterium]|nr:phosphatidate cytidylyltransferase [Gammaproteobacteria bacterium]